VTYHVVATPADGDGWDLAIAGVGVTQAAELDAAADLARDYIAVMLDRNVADVDVRIEVRG
jgi:hypothetical protein